MCVCVSARAFDTLISMFTHAFFFLSLRTCVSILQVYDILVVNQNYDGDGPGTLTLRRGDLVEVLEQPDKNEK